MAFEQAAIRVEKTQEFSELKSAIERVFSAERAQSYFKKLSSKDIRIRDLDSVLLAGVVDAVADAKRGTAKVLYEKLTVSDQAQMREFYLSKIEEVEPGLRAKFNKLYRYY